MISTEEEAKAWLNALPECDEAALGRLNILAELLAAENQRQNLVSAASMGEVWARHIVDSAQLLEHVPRGTSPWLDLGTGAGFPGLIVAALRPELHVVMVESRKRRVDWLHHACKEMNLVAAEVRGCRLEEMSTQRFSAISARAFAPLERLLTLSARFSTADTVWLLPKGRSAKQELDSLRGWDHMFHVERSVTDPEAGVIVGTLRSRKDKRS